MAAGLQALELNYLSKFVIAADNKVAWVLPMMDRSKMALHPKVLLQSSPVQADTMFGVWTKSVAETNQPLVEAIVGEAALSTRDQRKSINLTFCCFFNQLTNALLWIQL